MAVLDSGLETFDYGTSGWSAIEKTNLELLDVKLLSVMTGFKKLGEQTIADNAATATDPGAQTSETLTDSTGGTPSNTIADCGASYSQTTMNDNIASLVDEINKLRADVAESRTREAEYKTAILSLQSSLNDILAKLRADTGNGVLAAPA